MLKYFFVIILVYCLEGSDIHKSKCLSRYHDLASKSNPDLIGKLANVKLIEDFGYSVLIRYECPEHFQFVGKWKSYITRKVLVQCDTILTSSWANNWPVCRGRYENVTCSNEYFFSNSTNGKHWLQQSLNLYHALYSPVRKFYPFNYKLRFYCAEGLSLHEARGLSVMTTTCKNDGGWTKEWPLCKGQTCSNHFVANGIITNKNQRYNVGVVLHIKCKRGFYLWGSNTTVCTTSLRWSGHVAECVSLLLFRKKCKSDGKKLRLNYDAMLECYSESSQETIKNKDFQYELAIGIAIPSCFAVIVLTILIILYVRRQRNILLERHVGSHLSATYNRARVQLILPTYDEAVKATPTTPPPTFEETFQLQRDSMFLLSVSDNNNDRPPPYVDDAVSL